LFEEHRKENLARLVGNENSINILQEHVHLFRSEYEDTQYCVTIVGITTGTSNTLNIL